MASQGSEASEKPNPTNVGGQAVIEGVMMRAPGSLSVVCRRADGSLTLRERSVPVATGPFAKLPFLRGIHTLVSSVRIGHQALQWSASLMEADLIEQEEAEAAKKSGAAAKSAAKKATPSSVMLGLHALNAFLLSPLEEEPKAEEPKAEEAEAERPAEAAKKPAKKAPPPPVEEKQGSGILMALPILFAVLLFIALPQLAASGIKSLFKLSLDETSPGFQVITGAAKLVIIVSYMSLLRFTDMGKRMFQYHGAEHKSISAYEANKPLEVEHARGVSALHARCGTTFIILVAFVSVLVFSALGSLLGSFLPQTESHLLKSVLLFFAKLPFIPVVVGITFEIQRITARYCSTGPLRVFLWPGFLVQKITTAPPDDDQLEVAMASLRSALANASVALPEEHPDQSYESYAELIGDPAYRVG